MIYLNLFSIPMSTNTLLDLEQCLSHRTRLQTYSVQIANLIKNLEKDYHKLATEINALDQKVYTLCPHDQWTRGSDGGIDERPEKICLKCNLTI